MTRCVKCEREGRNANICSNCAACDYHTGCKCRICNRCDKRRAPKDICFRCMQCVEHHVGRIFDANEFTFRACEYKDDPKALASTFIINSLPRSLGVEIELGNFGTFTNISCHANAAKLAYHFEHDGSVKGSGRELVTGRMQGDQYLYGMTWLIKQLQEHGCEANNTCGYHVHVDAIDFNNAALRRILVAYALIQDQLYGTLVAKSRASGAWGQIYCPRLPQTHDQLIELMNLEEAQIGNWFNKYLYKLEYPSEELKTKDPGLYKVLLQNIKEKLIHQKSTKYVNHARRSALNFHSWMMRGTIEFRLKEGTLDPKSLLMWPLWCGWFVHKISELPDKEIFYWFKQVPSLLELAQDWKQEHIQKYIASSPKDEPEVNKPQPRAEPQASAVDRAVDRLDQLELENLRQQLLDYTNHWRTYASDLTPNNNQS